MYKIIIIVVVGMLVAGCDRHYDAEGSEDTQTYQHQSEAVVPEAEWESFKRETELTIDANQAKIRELRNTVSTKYSATVAALEETNEQLRKQLREFTYDGEEQWIAFRDRLSREMHDLSDAIDGVYTKTGKR